MRPFLYTSTVPGATSDVPHFIHPSYPIGPIAAISAAGDFAILPVRNGGVYESRRFVGDRAAEGMTTPAAGPATRTRVAGQVGPRWVKGG